MDRSEKQAYQQPVGERGATGSHVKEEQGRWFHGTLLTILFGPLWLAPSSGLWFRCEKVTLHPGQRTQSMAMRAQRKVCVAPSQAQFSELGVNGFC